MSRTLTRQPANSPDPTSAEGIIYSFVEGIALAILNTFFVLFFSELATLQQDLNSQTTLFNLGTIITVWGIVYFLFAYIVPIAAAYSWGDKAGVGVYFIGWMGTTLILNRSITVGMMLLVVAIVLVGIVDFLKNRGNKQNRKPHGGHR